MTAPQTARVVIFAMMGLPFVLFGLYGVHAGLETRSWTWSSGRVVVSEPIPGTTKGGRVEVEFPVGSARYRCQVVTPGFGANRRDTRDFPLGASAVVFYDPAQPSKCGLKPGVSPSMLVLVAFGLAMPLLAFFAKDGGVPIKREFVA
jgi:hypothetical protein